MSPLSSLGTICCPPARQARPGGRSALLVPARPPSTLSRTARLLRSSLLRGGRIADAAIPAALAGGEELEAGGAGGRPCTGTRMRSSPRWVSTSPKKSSLCLPAGFSSAPKPTPAGSAPSGTCRRRGSSPGDLEHDLDGLRVEPARASRRPSRLDPGLARPRRAGAGSRSGRAGVQRRCIVVFGGGRAPRRLRTGRSGGRCRGRAGGRSVVVPRSGGNPVEIAGQAPGVTGTAMISGSS